MFSVYDLSGQTFRGTLEEYLKVSGLAASRRARGIDQEELEPRATNVQRGFEQPDSGAFGQAAEAYRQMLREEIERGPILHAYQIMSREVMTLSPDTTVEEAWRQLTSRSMGQAPVVDGSQRLIGLVSSWDLLTVLNLEDGTLRDILARTVADVMTSPVVSADPVADIRRVAKVLVETHLPGLPVVSSQDELVGIITRSDILRALVNDPPLSLWA